MTIRPILEMTKPRLRELKSKLKTSEPPSEPESWLSWVQLKPPLPLLHTDAHWACPWAPPILQSRQPAKRLTAGAEKAPKYFPRRPAVESSQHINRTHQRSQDFPHPCGFMLWPDPQDSRRALGHPRGSLQERPPGRPQLVMCSGPAWSTRSKHWFTGALQNSESFISCPPVPSCPPLSLPNPGSIFQVSD